MKTKLIIITASLLMFLPFLGSTHLFDWDEINFAECAREMIETGDYTTVQINYQPFWEKPPLFIWMQVVSMKIFGINEFGARFPNVLAGIATLLVLFAAGKRVRDERLGLWWVVMYAGSILPHLYFRSGIIDPWFNLFIFLAFYRFWLGVHPDETTNKKRMHLALAGLFLGLAIMTKGPVAILVSGISLSIWLIWNRFRNFPDWKGLVLLIFFAGFTGGIWFILLFMQGNGKIFTDFIVYQIRLFQTQDAGHGGPFYYHFVILFIGCFPASIPAIARLAGPSAGKTSFEFWMKIMFWVTLILFSIVKTKIVHYSSLCYFPLTFLAAEQVYRMVEEKSLTWKKWMGWLIGTIGGIIALALTLVPYLMKNKDHYFTPATVKDPFAYANLQANVLWSGWEMLVGIGLFVFLITGLIFLRRHQMTQGILALSIGVVITLTGAAAVILPRIEGYSQNAAITYFESLEGKDVYVHTLGYKSYAHLFYAKTKPSHHPRHHDENWLTREDADKTVYFISKNKVKDEYLGYYPELKVIGEKNGFVFYVRERY